VVSLRRQQMRANIPARVLQLEKSFGNLTHMLISAGVLEIDRSGPQPIIRVKNSTLAAPEGELGHDEEAGFE